MQNQEYSAVWDLYLSAWSDISVEERRKRLESCVTDDCIYTDPTEQRHGRADLMARIEISQERYPGAHFVNDKFLHHHGQGTVIGPCTTGEERSLPVARAIPAWQRTDG